MCALKLRSMEGDWRLRTDTITKCEPNTQDVWIVTLVCLHLPAAPRRPLAPAVSAGRPRGSQPPPSPTGSQAPPPQGPRPPSVLPLGCHSRWMVAAAAPPCHHRHLGRAAAAAGSAGGGAGRHSTGRPRGHRGRHVATARRALPWPPSIPRGVCRKSCRGQIECGGLVGVGAVTNPQPPQLTTHTPPQPPKSTPQFISLATCHTCMHAQLVHLPDGLHGHAGVYSMGQGAVQDGEGAAEGGGAV